MKKITSFLSLLLLAFCSIGASAQTTVTIVDGGGTTPDTYGTRSNGNKTFTTIAESGLAGLTVNINGTIDRANSWFATNQYAMCIKPSATQTAEKITITAPSGYMIKSYSMSVKGYQSSTWKISTTVDETDVATNGTDVSSTAVDINASDIYTQSTNLTIYNVSSLDWLLVGYFTVTLVPENTETIETGYYYLYNKVGGYLDGSTGSYAWKNSSDLSANEGVWYIENLGEGTDGNIKYYIKSIRSGYYFGGVGGHCPLNSTRQYQRISVRESGAYYTLSGHKDVSQIGNKTAIKYNGTSGNLIYRDGGNIDGTTFDAVSQWQIVPADFSRRFPMEFSTDLANAKWYYMNIRTDRWCQYNVSFNPSATYNKNTATSLGVLTQTKGTISDPDSYLWAFMLDPTTCNIKVYNKAAGTSSMLYPTANRPTFSTTDAAWIPEINSTGFTLHAPGTSNYINENNTTVRHLMYWNNANASTDDGSTFRVLSTNVITVNVVDTENNPLNTISFNSCNGFTYDLYGIIGVDSHYVTLSQSTVTGTNADQTFTITASLNTSNDLPFTASTALDPIWYAMSTANTSSWWKDNGNNNISNANGNSLPTGIADAYAWAFYGDIFNGYKIQNKSTGRYLGGRTTTGGNLTLVDEADAVLFVPEYNSATNIRWKSKDYGYYVDRSGGSPYAHTSGQVINFQNLYNVNFTCSGGQLSTVYVGGTEVSLNTPVVLASGAIITSGALVNAIETYNGFNTLAEALADAGFNGTVDVALSAVLSNITINVMRGSTVVKTVTIENVPENAVITVADAVGTPNYVSNLTPATITATSADQSVDVTYTSSLPFTLSDDPTSAGATEYILTLNSQYCYGNALSSSCDFGNSYYWTFGGDEYNGITVYNKNNGYLRIATSNNTPATFDSSTPFAFAISPNTVQTNAFSLYVPGSSSNTYVNKRTSTIATWETSASNAISDAGCCLKIYTENDAVAGFLSDLQPYFTYAGCVNALTTSAAAELNSIYESFTQNPPRASEYLALKATIEANVVQPTEGYYIVYSGFDGFNPPVAMYYNTSNNKIAWKTSDGNAPHIIKLKAVSGASTYRLYSPLADKYLQTKDGTTNAAEESGLALEVMPISGGKIALVDANGGDNPALHAGGHGNGANSSGALQGYGTGGAASWWRLQPVDIPEITLIEPNGVAEGDEVYQSFAYGSNKQLPLNVGVHYISTNSGNFAHIETVSSSAIRANEGYIIRGVKGATVPLLPIGEVDALSSTNLLVGVVEPTKVYSGYMLAYKGNDAEQKFYKIKNTGLTIPAYRSYLTAAAAANVRGLELLFGGIGDDEITGIDGINTGGTEGAIFDLQGRRVTKPEKGGIYIINGKKVMK